MARQIDSSYIKEERTAPSGDQSLGELFADLTRDMSTLVRQEMQLAKTEMSHKATQLGRDIGFLVAGAAVAYAGFLAIIAALVIVVAHAVDWWLAALIVGVVVAAIGGYLVWQGINDLKTAQLAPTQTLDTLKEDTKWARDQVS